MSAAANFHEVLCTVHNLRFSFDWDRVRALGTEPALMKCPMCAHKESKQIGAELAETRKHRDVLLEAIDIARTLKRAE